jgi:hypothetical protein
MDLPNPCTPLNRCVNNNNCITQFLCTEMHISIVWVRVQFVNITLCFYFLFSYFLWQVHLLTWVLIEILMWHTDMVWQYGHWH